jgi:ankyrin repeat protein
MLDAMARDPRAYVLDWHPGRVWDADFNVWLDRGDYGMIWSPGSSRATSAERFTFHGMHEIVADDDFPANDVGWPIVSRAMADALRAVGEFEHALIPVDVVDAAADATGPRAIDDRFALLHLPRHLDALDVAASRAELIEGAGGLVSAPRMLVLRDDVALPPVFRLTAYPWVLLVSAAARAALEAAKVRSVAFRELHALNDLMFAYQALDPWAMERVVTAQALGEANEKLFQMIRSPSCDRAVALRAYWRAGAAALTAYADEGAVPDKLRAAWRLVHAIEHRYHAGFYKLRLRYFNPADDGGRDLTGRRDLALAPVRELPRVMLEPTGERPEEALSPPERLRRLAAAGDRRAMQQLLMAGVDVNGRGDGDEDTALHVAARGGHLDVVELLVEYGAQVSALNRLRRTPLHLAAVAGHVAVVRSLLAAGAPVDATGHSDRPLDLALRKGHADVVDLLLEAGACLTDRDPVLLHEAVAGRSVAVMRALVARGADLAGRDGRGATPLLRAAEQGWVEGAALALELGAALDATDAEGKTALHLAAQADRSAACRWLVAQGLDLEARDARGLTPLLLAILDHAEGAARVLLSHGARHDAEALGAAIGWDLAEPGIVRALLDHGAEIAAALHLACAGGHLALVEELLARGADVAAPAADGALPLHVAAGRGVGSAPTDKRAAVVARLLAAGAAPGARDAAGATALHHAAVADAAEVAGLLLAAGAPTDAVTTGPFAVGFETAVAPGATARVVAEAVGAQAVIALLP